MTPVQAAFVALVTILHPHLPCHAPKEVYSSDFITGACQRYALPHHVAVSCYDPGSRTIFLPDSCADTLTDSYCNRLAYHEADRYIEQVCMAHHFTEAEPPSVIRAERYASS